MDQNPTQDPYQPFHQGNPTLVEEEGTAAKKTALANDNGPRDVEYASIDFSVLKRRNHREGGRKPETTETVYAEINKKVKNVTEENEEENGQEESKASEEKEEEAKHSVPVEEQGEDMVYSNVKDMLGEI